MRDDLRLVLRVLRELVPFLLLSAALGAFAWVYQAACLIFGGGA